jgi:hypothetical protein
LRAIWLAPAKESPSPSPDASARELGVTQGRYICVGEEKLTTATPFRTIRNQMGKCEAEISAVAYHKSRRE